MFRVAKLASRFSVLPPRELSLYEHLCHSVLRINPLQLQQGKSDGFPTPNKFIAAHKSTVKVLGFACLLFLCTKEGKFFWGGDGVFFCVYFFFSWFLFFVTPA